MIVLNLRTALALAGCCLVLTTLLVGTEESSGLVDGAGKLAQQRSQAQPQLSSPAPDRAADPAQTPASFADEEPVAIQSSMVPRAVPSRDSRMLAAPQAASFSGDPPITQGQRPDLRVRQPSAPLGRDHGNRGSHLLAEDLRSALP